MKLNLIENVKSWYKASCKMTIQLLIVVQRISFTLHPYEIEWTHRIAPVGVLPFFPIGPEKSLLAYSIQTNPQVCRCCMNHSGDQKCWKLKIQTQDIKFRFLVSFPFLVKYSHLHKLYVMFNSFLHNDLPCALNEEFWNLNIHQ